AGEPAGDEHDVEGLDPEHAASLRSARTGQKNPRRPGRGWEAFLLSHIKAPAQGGKAGDGNPPAPNLTKGAGAFKARTRTWFPHPRRRSGRARQEVTGAARHAAAHGAQFST